MTTHRCTTTAFTSILAGLALVGAACTGSPPTRSGQRVEPVSLSSATSGAGGVGGDVLAVLVEQSADAAVRIAAPTIEPQTEDNEGDIIAALAAGEADVSVVRADRLATAGAHSLGVLQIPMLVTSPDHAAKVASDPIAADLMADLDDIGLVGLALVPGGVRHPFGYGAPLLGPEDYRDQTINTRVGAGVDALFAALGASTEHSGGDVRTQHVADGTLRGIEVSLQQFVAVDKPAVVTSNVTLYTKFDVVVIRKAAWERLTDPQRDALRAAATAAGAAAVADRDSEAEGLDRWCATEGGSSVVATVGQIADIRAALQPTIDAATSDLATATLAERVTELGEGTTAPTGKACGTSATVTSAPVTSGTAGSGTAPGTTEELTYAVEPRGPQNVLEGVWRLSVDRQSLLDQGFSATDAGANAGVWTITIHDNIATVDQPSGSDCTWEFRFDGDAVSIDMGAQGNDACVGHVIGTYTRGGDVVMVHFDREKDYDVALDNAMFREGMQKIG